MSDARDKLKKEERKHVPFTKFVRESKESMTLGERYKAYDEAGLADIKRQEEKTKEKIKAKKEQLQHEKERTKEEQKRLINREVGTLKAMADDESKDANRYRDAAKDTPLPTLSKLLFILASEEQTHEQRLRMLAAELERGIL